MGVLMLSGTLVFAEAAKTDDAGDKASVAAAAAKARSQMMMGSMQRMMMMQALREKAVVPTSDGGIVIVLGNKLTKYDKDLNVVKETEIKVDTEAMMQQNMMGGMPGYSLMKSPMPTNPAQNTADSRTRR